MLGERINIFLLILDNGSKDIIRVLERLPEKRSKQHVNLLKLLTQDLPFFKEYIQSGQQHIHEQCCVYMQHQAIDEKQSVFKIGEIGDKFYIVLSGKVEIHAKVGQNEDGTAILKCVKVLEEGASFGEVALLKNQPRLASVICQKCCNFATLDKASFDRILKQAEDNKLDKEMQFFAQMPLFSKWNKNMLKLLYLNAFKETYKKGDYIFQEGQPAEAVYISCSGEFTATKKFRQELGKEENYLQQPKTDSLKLKSLQRDRSPTKSQRIVVWTSLELFGEEDLIVKRNERSFSVQCTSFTGSLVKIKKNDFVNRVMWDESSRQYVLERFKSKEIWFDGKVDYVNKLMSFSDLAAFYYNNTKQRNRIQLQPQSNQEELREFHKQVIDVMMENAESLDQKYNIKQATIASGSEIPSQVLTTNKDKYNQQQIRPQQQENDNLNNNIPLGKFKLRSKASKNSISQPMIQVDRQLTQNNHPALNLQKSASNRRISNEPKSNNQIESTKIEIDDELVERFSVELKKKFRLKFGKNKLKEFNSMAQHLNHQCIKKAIIEGDGSAEQLVDENEGEVENGIEDNNMSQQENKKGKVKERFFLKIKEANSLLKQELGQDLKLDQGVNINEKEVIFQENKNVYEGDGNNPHSAQRNSNKKSQQMNQLIGRIASNNHSPDLFAQPVRTSNNDSSSISRIKHRHSVTNTSNDSRQSYLQLNILEDKSVASNREQILDSHQMKEVVPKYPHISENKIPARQRTFSEEQDKNQQQGNGKESSNIYFPLASIHSQKKSKGTLRIGSAANLSKRNSQSKLSQVQPQTTSSSLHQIPLISYGNSTSQKNQNERLSSAGRINSKEQQSSVNISLPTGKMHNEFLLLQSKKPYEATQKTLPSLNNISNDCSKIDKLTASISKCSRPPLRGLISVPQSQKYNAYLNNIG